MRLKNPFKQEPAIMKDLEPAFWSYFHNKMMMLLMMIEHPLIARSVLSVERQRIFLEDLYHHFVPLDVHSKYHHAFRWLSHFLACYPDVGPRRIYRAMEMVGLIYEAFGLRLDKRLEAVRLEREMHETAGGPAWVARGDEEEWRHVES